MIRLLVIVFALIIAVGAGLGGLIHFGVLPDFTGMVPVAGQDQTTEDTEPAPPPRAPEPIFVSMDPLLIPVILDGEVQSSIYIAFRLQVAEGQQEEATFRLPQLRDVYMRALYDMVPKQMATRKTLDLRKLKARLKVITDRVLGEGVVEDVIVVSVFER